MENLFVRAPRIFFLVALPLATTLALSGCGSGSGNRSLSGVASGGSVLPIIPAIPTTPTVPTTPTTPTTPTGTVTGSVTYDADVITTDVIGTVFTPTTGSLILPSAFELSSGLPYLSSDFVFTASEGEVDASGTPDLLRKFLINLTPTIQAGQSIDLKPPTQIVFTDISLNLEETRRGDVRPRKFKAISGNVTVVSVVDSGKTRTYTLLLTDVAMIPTSGGTPAKFTVRGTLTYTGSIPSTGSGLPGLGGLNLPGLVGV